MYYCKSVLFAFSFSDKTEFPEEQEADVSGLYYSFTSLPEESAGEVAKESKLLMKL